MYNKIDRDLQEDNIANSYNNTCNNDDHGNDFENIAISGFILNLRCIPPKLS